MKGGRRLRGFLYRTQAQRATPHTALLTGGTSWYNSPRVRPGGFRPGGHIDGGGVCDGCIGLDRGSPWRFDHFPETCCASPGGRCPRWRRPWRCCSSSRRRRGAPTTSLRIRGSTGKPAIERRIAGGRCGASRCRHDRARGRAEDQAALRGRLPALGVPLPLAGDDPRPGDRRLVPADQRRPRLRAAGRPAGPEDRLSRADRPVPEHAGNAREVRVVLLGDVDPREFSDGQFRMLIEFVTQKGGGFGMVAGPRFSPAAYRSTRWPSCCPSR